MATPGVWAELNFFSPYEFDSPDHMQDELLVKLNFARLLAGIPFIINSDYRKDSNTSHGLGKGVDIKAETSSERFAIVNAALQAGFTRIGVYDKHCHLDVATSEDDPKYVQDVMWWGTSQ